MRNSFLSLKIVIIFCISFASKELHGQLGFCQGNSGDPIFTETFGSGTNYGPQLPAGTTTYSFVGNSGPQDGEYTIGSNTFSYGWNMPTDHTVGDTNGKALIVNASFTTGEFYTTSVSGLCENTTYEFSSWLLNILPSSGCGGNGIPVNVQFEIWDNTNTSLLASGITGSIFGTATPSWQQYGLVFQTLPGQTEVILKMINNGAGGCGNDLAIDDIVFKTCGDLITLEDSNSNDAITICSSQAPFSETITAIPDNTVFSAHFYQWQVSTDGLNWSDILGETNASISFTGITATTYYRAKVSEFEANLANSDCITLSDVYQITINQAPSPPSIECWETATFDVATCSWLVTGTQPVAPAGIECWQTAMFNNVTCIWDISGTQPVQPNIECWETTIFNNSTCSWDVSGTQPEAPTDLVCGEIATFNNVTCSWDITGGQPVEPTLECWESAIFNDTTCQWDVTGSQPAAPTDLECSETAAFNNTTCTWEVTSNQPTAPTVECWETATFNNTTCLWEVTGVQPLQPTLECWQTTTFNTSSCAWDITGTQPQQPIGLECWEIATFNDTTCSWDVTGAQPAAPTDLECWETTSFSNSSCSWEIFGTQSEAPADLACWQTATFNTTACAWEITGLQPSAPIDLECWQTTEFNVNLCEWEIFGTQSIEFRDQFLSICENEELTLEAISSIVNPMYEWVSGEMSQSITIDTEGIYEVEVTDGCSTEIITFNVSLIENPIIESVVTEGSAIIVNLVNNGDYLYSINGVDYQFSNVFGNVPIGFYTIYVKASLCNVAVTSEHFHFFVQKFMTPNNDGNNDVFSLNVSQYFSKTEVYIFNRYGQLLYSAINRNAEWDGTANGKKLPTSDYWYRIVLNGKAIAGHFTLKR